MKKMKKLIAVILAAVMVLALAIPAMATGETHTLTINSADGSNKHQFVAYQIFAGTVSSDGETLSDVEWGTGVNTTTTINFDGDTRNLLEAIAVIGDGDKKPFASSTTAADVAKILGTYADDSAVAQEFAETVAKYLNEDSGITAQAATGADGTYTINNLDSGYYLVRDKFEGTEGVKPSDLLLKIVYSTTINAKVSTATVTKTAGAAGTDDNTSFGVGDSIPYTLTGTLPDDFDAAGTGNYLYQFVDTMDAVLSLECEIDQNTATADIQTVTRGVTVTIGDTDVTDNFVITKTTNNSGNTVLTVKCENIRDINNVSKDSQVVVSYNATLTQMPENTNEVSNTVQLTYDVETQTTEITEKVFPLTLSIVKQDGDDSTKALAGAEFQLSRVITVNGTQTTYYLSNNTGTITWSENPDEAVTLTTDKDGLINVKGIPAGSYLLKETKAPDGYNILSNEIKLLITASITTDTTTGLETLDTLEILVDDVAGTANLDTGTVTATIANYTGATLPSTGGIGTTIFYVIGAIIVVGAAVILITRRRMNAGR